MLYDQCATATATERKKGKNTCRKVYFRAHHSSTNRHNPPPAICPPGHFASAMGGGKSILCLFVGRHRLRALALYPICAFATGRMY